MLEEVHQNWVERVEKRGDRLAQYEVADTESGTTQEPVFLGDNPSHIGR